MMTPSSLDRVQHCLVSEALPHYGEQSEDGEHGREVHALLQAIIEKGEETALAEAPDELREMFLRFDRARLPPLAKNHYAPEVSFGLDLQTGQAREIGRGLSREERDKLAHPSEMTGTADLVGVEAEAVVVGDWKTRYDGRVAQVTRNPQLRTYALMAARAYGRSSAKVFIAWVLDDGSTWSDVAEMDALELDAHEAELRELAERREGLFSQSPNYWPAPNIGPWCKYCPAMRACPAQVTMVRALAGSDIGALGEIGELTPERAASAWTKLQQARRMLDTIDATVRQYARQHPVDLGDGYVLGEHEVAIEKIVPERAAPVLEAALGPAGKLVAGEAIETDTKMTKAALSRALRKHVLTPDKKITHLERDALRALAEGKAMSVSVHRRVEEFKRPAADK